MDIAYNKKAALCLGTVQFGMDYGVQGATRPDLSDSLKILEIALQNGIEAIDTAAAYGNAEDVVGTFLKIEPGIRNKIFLVSKTPPNLPEDASFEQRARSIRENITRSLDKLHTDYLDAFLLHNPAQIFDDAIVETLMQLKREGIVKKTGVSVYTSDEARKGIERGVDILQIPYSVLDQRMAEQGVLSLAQEHGVQLHARSAFTQGLLLMDETEIPPYLENARPVIRAYSQFCVKYEISRLRLALSFVGRQEAVSHIVFGVDKQEQLMEIISAYKQPVADDILKEASRRFSGIDEEIVMPNRWKK